MVVWEIGQFDDDDLFDFCFFYVLCDQDVVVDVFVFWCDDQCVVFVQQMVDYVFVCVVCDFDDMFFWLVVVIVVDDLCEYVVVVYYFLYFVVW